MLRTPAAATLLSAWERSQAQPPTERALTLLAAADPEIPRESLARLSIGQRDAALLTLRERLFGPSLASVTSCPACGERLEMALDAAGIRSAAPDEAPPMLDLAVDGFRARVRLPDSVDLLALAHCTDPAEGRLHLLERCLLDLRRGDEPASVAQVTPALFDAIEEAMAQADPQADVRLALSCPGCGHTWEALFDIAAYLWTELSAWVGRLLREVDVLARAYGWGEAEILSLSAWRRRAYLDLVNQ